MQFMLKVSPKGQVIFPKKLRTALEINEFVKIELKDKNGILKKPEKITAKLAGSLKKYARTKKITIKEAIAQAVRKTAHEIASKNN